MRTKYKQRIHEYMNIQKKNIPIKPAARSRRTKWAVEEMTHARGINKNKNKKKGSSIMIVITQM